MAGWLITVFVAAALLVGGVVYMTAMPGASYSGPLAAPTAGEQHLARNLRRHVTELARSDRNLQRPGELERAAKYVEAAFAEYGLPSTAHRFTSAGVEVRNIEVTIPPTAAANAPALVVGAHYDSVPGSPGSDDNASGVAALLELARLLASHVPPEGRAIRLVAFANEEPPYFMSGDMGSEAWARRAHSRGDRVLGMISLEMLGFYDDRPRSQAYPFPLGLFYPDRANFIAFVGDLGSRPLVRRAIGAFRAHAKFPSEGVAAPATIPGVHWSDHWSFRKHGYAAIMVTDTAFFRYPHYHMFSDTPDKLDYERMARVTAGLAAMAKDLVAQGAE